MTKELVLFDSTLRDGTQGEGVSLSCDDKLRIARRLDEFGVDYIEGGWPGSNPKDMEFFERAQNELSLKHARITAFGSTVRAKTKPEDDPQVQLLIQANTPVITIFGKTWDLHVREVLRTSMQENLRMIQDTVAYLKSHGKEVIYDAEHFFDGYQGGPGICAGDAARRHYGRGRRRGAVRYQRRLPALGNGRGRRHGTARGTRSRRGRQRRAGGFHVVLGIHAHNDSETGVANTLAAVQHGATHIQGTINGYGERCGNANLVSVIPDLQLKMGYDLVPPEKLGQLTDLSRFVSELANLNPDTHQPFVGASAFAHKGGTHVNAVVKYAMSYQHIDPTAVGNETRVLVSELSGKDNIAVKRAGVRPGRAKP